jgi:ribosomal protein S18 acetylase RimI-like enzyme
MIQSRDENDPKIKIMQVESEEQLAYIRELFKEYAESLGFDLDFQNFEKEFSELPGEYAPPYGCLLLALYGEKIAGCIALRKFNTGICEMKRLYVRPEFRGKGIGKRLSTTIIKKAREIGYRVMRIDTIPTMTEANTLYKMLGFKKIAPYRYNPIQGALFFELQLN